MSTILLTTLAINASSVGQGGSPAIPWLRIAAAFLICIAFAIGAILWLRWRQGLTTDFKTLAAQLIRPAPLPAELPLVVEERLRVSPVSQFLILRCGTRRYLIHSSPQAAQLIDRLDDGADSVAAPAP